MKQSDSHDLSSEKHSAPVSHTFAVHQQEMNYGEASSESLVQIPASPTEAHKSHSKQSLAALHSGERTDEREQGQQRGGAASSVQTQVLNMATVESKGTSINQHKAAVASTSALMLDDLKMLDKEMTKDTKAGQGNTAKPQPEKKQDKPQAQPPKPQE